MDFGMDFGMDWHGLAWTGATRLACALVVWWPLVTGTTCIWLWVSLRQNNEAKRTTTTTTTTRVEESNQSSVQLLFLLYHIVYSELTSITPLNNLYTCI
jgi:hypothetical protein